MRACASAAVLTAIAVAASLALVRCSSPCTPGGDGAYKTALYDTLDKYCMVGIEDGAIVPSAGVVPYDVSSPLFSDYAIKVRTLWMPPGTSATYSSTDVIDMPVGTIITKSFGFPDAGGKTHWVETRVLTRQAAGWVGVSYVWNEDQTRATIAAGGTIVDLKVADQTAHYLVPSKTQCIKCHENLATVVPIGLKADRLNHDFSYGTTTENQLTHLTNAKMLSGAPDPSQAPKLAAWDDTSVPVVDRARAYLDANCAHCHSATGEARTTALHLGVKDTDIGICKAPIATGRATGGRLFDIVPGKPDESILVYRMESTEPSVMMPEIGRSLVHTEGLALVREWISGLSGTCP